MENFLGLDIGGANLKAAHTSGVACQVPFAMWKNPLELSDRLREVVKKMPACDTLAVTMTGELCDCFANRSEGVKFILDAVEKIAEDRRIRIWSTCGSFVEIQEARTIPLEIASANWLALATFACQNLQNRPGLLIDIGSTTTDIIRLGPNGPQPLGRTDLARLQTGELVYSGVRRTPLCALLSGPVMAEFFATTFDVYVELGLLPENPEDHDTADGRGASKPFARARLARMVGADAEMLSEKQIRNIAQEANTRQIELLRKSIRKILNPRQTPLTVVLAGSGEFLARLALQDQPDFSHFRVLSLNEELGPEISRAACAYAVARLAADNNTETKPC
jgi:probable H4MPT-linked C1 transfer pathway protein